MGELIEECWRLRLTRTGKELVCGIYQTATGVEVRAGFRDDAIHAQPAVDLADARALAAAFKREMLDSVDGCEEMPPAAPEPIH